MSQHTTAFRASRLDMAGQPYGPQFTVGDDDCWAEHHWTVYMGAGTEGETAVELDGKPAYAEDVPGWFAANAVARRPMSGEVTTATERYDGVVALRLVSSDPVITQSPQG